MDWKSLESRPGSFSKNFGWGAAQGLGLLHQAINVVFENGLTIVPRDMALRQIGRIADGDPLIPLNFFLYNQVIDGISYIVPDQLVLDALERDHDQSFDRLAMCALNFSRVGVWDRASPFQSHPAPWARRFVVEEIWDGARWDRNKINTDNMEQFFQGNMAYKGRSPRKYATNLQYLYQISSLHDLSSSETEEWWASALFLFLDRCMMDQEIHIGMSTDDILGFVVSEAFWALTAANPTLAPYAARPIIEDYIEMGGLERLRENKAEFGKAPNGVAEAARPKNRDQRKLLMRRRKPSDLGLTAVQRAYAQAQLQVRNRPHAEWVKNLYENRCAICGQALAVDALGKTYSEAGHVKPVGDPFQGPDHLRNILPFCPNHHKAFDRGGVWIHPNDGVPIVRSATNETHLEGRQIELHEEHGFDIKFVEWHAKYFRHLS